MDCLCDPYVKKKIKQQQHKIYVSRPTVAHIWKEVERNEEKKRIITVNT